MGVPAVIVPELCWIQAELLGRGSVQLSCCWQDICLEVVSCDWAYVD
jgi:hypothetical protein